MLVEFKTLSPKSCNSSHVGKDDSFKEDIFEKEEELDSKYIVACSRCTNREKRERGGANSTQKKKSLKALEVKKRKIQRRTREALSNKADKLHGFFNNFENSKRDFDKVCKFIDAHTEYWDPDWGN